jgi:two-component system chemotaxis response regulator CheY
MAKIIIVDDSVTVRKMVSSILKRDGHEVSESQDGRRAFTIASKSQFDLVLTDLIMPGCSGIDLLRKLKQLQRYTQVPVLLMSTDNQETTKAEGRVAGAAGWITKPFDPAKLRSTVNYLLQDQPG